MYSQSVEKKEKTGYGARFAKAKPTEIITRKFDLIGPKGDVLRTPNQCTIAHRLLAPHVSLSLRDWATRANTPDHVTAIDLDCV